MLRRDSINFPSCGFPFSFSSDQATNTTSNVVQPIYGPRYDAATFQYYQLQSQLKRERRALGQRNAAPENAAEATKVFRRRFPNHGEQSLGRQGDMDAGRSTRIFVTLFIGCTWLGHYLFHLFSSTGFLIWTVLYFYTTLTIPA
jgi:hypothetical protein